MLRRLLVALTAIALVIGLAPNAMAQSSTTRVGNFDFTVTLDTGQSDLRPGGHVRFNLVARNHQSGFPFTPSVLNTYGLVMPGGFAGLSGGGSDMGSVGDHGQANYWGGQPSVTDRPVGRGSTRSGWLSMRIPGDAVGGTVYNFGLLTNLETFQAWQPTVENVIRFTLPSVGTRTAVTADPATVEEGGATTLTASVTPVHGSNVVDGGTVVFSVDGTSIGSVPVGENGRASIPHSVPLLEDREPVTQNITAAYSGLGQQFSGSQGSTTVTVDPEPKSEVSSIVGLTATRGLVEDGRLPVTLDVTIDPSDGNDLPEGSRVEMLRNGVVIETVAVDGVAATHTDHLDAVVTDPARYVYTARLLETETYDTIYRGAESEPVEVLIAPERTPVLLVEVDPASVLVGRGVDITASLMTGDGPLPAGSEVIIRADGRDIGTVVTDADGNAVLEDHVFATAGAKRIVAVFDGVQIGGVTYQPAVSSPFELIVESLPVAGSETTIELQTEVTAGDSVTFTAVVSRSDGGALLDSQAADLGAVWFFQDGKAVGSAPVVIDPATGEAKAVFVHRFAARGEYRITADYSGVSGVDEVVAPSETAAATVVTVLPSAIIIDEPGPPATPGGGSLDLGSLAGLVGDSGSLSALGAAS
ncbi:MAG: Ig-like domain-containing protein [Dietzia sp.]